MGGVRCVVQYFKNPDVYGIKVGVAMWVANTLQNLNIHWINESDCDIVFDLKGCDNMQRKLLTNGNTFKRTDNRWCGVVWYMNECGERKRKSFSGTSKNEVNKKITEYISEFEQKYNNSEESKKMLKDSMQNWLQVFKFPSVEQTTYDRYECVAQHQIYPLLGDKVVGDITASDVKKVLNHLMNEGYAYTTVKKAYVELNEYFRYLYSEELIARNPMANVSMIKKGHRIKKIFPKAKP